MKWLGGERAAAALAAGVLLVEVLVFFRHVLFLPGFVLPWDLGQFHLPHAHFIADRIGQGDLPLWDPYTYCGRPFLANIQTAVFYPATLLVGWVGSLAGVGHLRVLLEWNVVLHIWFAGLGAWWFGRKLGLGRPAALLLASAYQLSGYFAAHPEHMGATMAAAWLPWCWGLVLAGSRWRLSAALALVFLAGHTPVAVLVYGFTVLVAFLHVDRGDRGWRPVWRTLEAALFSLLLIAAQLIPAIELTRQSVGRYRQDWLQAGGGMPWGGFVSLVWPNYYGVFDPSRYRGPIDLTFVYLYAGLLTVPLAAVALWQVRRHSTTRRFALVALAAAFVLLGDQTALWRRLYHFLPENLRAALHPEFNAPVFLLALAALAALALDRLRLSPRVQWCAVAVLSIDAILVSSGRPMNAYSRALDPGVSREQVNGATANLEKVRDLAQTVNPPWRIDTIDDSFAWTMAAPTTQLFSAGGNDALALARVIQARLPFVTGQRWGAYYPVTRPDSPVLGLHNVRFLLTRRREPPSGPLVFVTRVPGSLIYQNLNVLPRFFLVDRVRAALSMEAAAHLLNAPDFRPFEEAIVEASAAPALDAWQYAEMRGTVRVVVYGYEGVELETDAPGRRYLVTSEAHYPGWQAWIDGAEQPLYYTNVAFRGLPVPAGRHRVQLAFRPRSFYGPAFVSAAAWLGLLLGFLVWVGRFRIRRIEPSR